MARACAVVQPVIVACGAAAFLLLAAPALAQPPQPASQTLPGGASQLQETHGDWRVTCAQQAEQRLCALTQQVADKESRQLVTGVELKAMSGDRAEGTLVLPFGLAVTKPVSLQVDDGSLMLMSFRTCLPVGCIVSLKFEAPTVKLLRTGTVLNVKGTADNAQETAFKISLKGFGSALDRTAALSK